jgi:hypothetical protein
MERRPERQVLRGADAEPAEDDQREPDQREQRDEPSYEAEAAQAAPALVLQNPPRRGSPGGSGDGRVIHAATEGPRETTGGWYILWVELGLIGTSVALWARHPG